MTFEVLDSTIALTERAAQVFAEDFRAAIAARRKFHVALSGGSTPRPLYQRLMRTPYDLLPWAQAHFYWGDERAVPPDHRESNYRLARTNLLDPLTILPDQVHRMRGEGGPEAAEEYEQELRDVLGAEPVLDLALMGMGADGHTASLFPGAAALESSRLCEYSPERGGRLTLTLKVFNAARRALFLVAGRDKAKAVAEAQKGLNPAGRVRPAGGTLWLVDHEAASLLETVR